MTKPVPTGKRYQEAYEQLEQIARTGNRQAIEGLYFMLGNDRDNAVIAQKAVIELFDLIAEAMSKMSKQQIHAVLELLDK